MENYNELATLSLAIVLIILRNKNKLLTILIYDLCKKVEPHDVYCEIIHWTERFSS